MKKTISIFASLLTTASATLVIGSVSQAGQLNCAGSYFGYSFNSTATTSGQRITGQIHLVITSGGTRKISQLTPSSSELRRGEYVRFAASGADGSGTLEAAYNPDGQVYEGTLAARTTSGNANVPVTCTLTGSLTDEEQAPN